MIKDVSDYFVDKNKSTQYDYKILLYGNYTYRKNLEADSLVEVLRHTIPFISKRWKVHFTLLIPEFVQSLDFPNVDQRIYELPSYINTMRQHFNTKQFMKHVDWKRNDFDIVYTHLPEHTLQIANCLNNNSNLSPKFIGYSHWFEVPQNAPYGDRGGDQPAKVRRLLWIGAIKLGDGLLQSSFQGLPHRGCDQDVVRGYAALARIEKAAPGNPAGTDL